MPAGGSGNGADFLLVDMFPGGFGSLQAKTGSGYAQIGGEACLRLRKKGSLSFRYYVRPDGMICSQDGQPTAYSLNAEYELLENGKPLFVRQRRGYRRENTGAHEKDGYQSADASFLRGFPFSSRKKHLIYFCAIAMIRQT